MKQKKKTGFVLNPLQYSHAAECWIHSCQEANRAMSKMLKALDEQQGPDWIHAQRRVRIAGQHLRRADFWAREGLKNPLRDNGGAPSPDGRLP